MANRDTGSPKERSKSSMVIVLVLVFGTLIAANIYLDRPFSLIGAFGVTISFFVSLYLVLRRTNG